MVRSSSHTHTPTARADWTVATRPKATAYPSRKSSLPIGIASSRSSVPEVRSRSVVTEVTRNMMMNGISASSAGPRLEKPSPGSPSNIHQSRVISAHGSTSSIARVRWSRRSWVSTRVATAPVARGVSVVFMLPPARGPA